MSRSLPALTFPEGGWCEALKTSYQPGIYIPKTREEYEALVPFASGPVVEIEPDEDEKAKAALVEEALVLKVADKNGKPISRSVIERYALDRLTILVVEARRAELNKQAVEARRAELNKQAVEAGLCGTEAEAEEIAKLSDEDLAALIAEAKA